MSYSMNKIQIIGTVGKDPELKEGKNGGEYVRIGVATSHGVKKGNDWENITTWHNVVAFKSVAVQIAKFAHKGSKIAIDGRLQKSTYTDRDGNEKESVEIVAFDVVTFDAGRPPQQAEKQAELPVIEKQAPLPVIEKQADDDNDGFPF